MIVEFSVRNFRSIKELQTISFVATGLKSPSEMADVDSNNISIIDNTRLLKTIGIYGANGSGKSNLILAFEYFLKAIKNEASSESNLGFLCDPFLYQEDSYHSESFFQIVLIVDDKKYRYGFTVHRNPKFTKSLDDKLSKDVVTNEWLFGIKEKNMVEYFIRKGMEVSKEKLPNSKSIPNLTYEHTLYLTHSAAFNKNGDSATIRNYLSGWTVSNFLSGDSIFRRNTLLLIEKENKKNVFLDLLLSFDLKYDDIVIERDSDKIGNEVLPQEKIFMIKSYSNNKNEIINIRLNLANNESSGTKKLFDLAGLLLRAFNMNKSALIIIDEIDSNFHPSLLIKLIKLFNDPEINRSNSQLLFTSHDTNLMSPALMRRDQFYFAEKNGDESTRLYSLADLRGIRNDADFAKQYLAGIYGALPILSNYSDEKSN